MQADFFFDNLDHEDFYFDLYHTLDHIDNHVSCRQIFFQDIFDLGHGFLDHIFGTVII